MGSLNDRVRALEQAQPDYPEHIVRAAMGRLRTEELRRVVVALRRVVEEGAPVEVAGPAVRRISELCQEIKKEGVL